MTSRSVHLVTGTSAAGVLARSGLDPDAILLSEDDLACGPLRPFESVEAWGSLRLGFWAEVTQSEIDIDPRDVITNLTRIREADSITAWLGYGAPDQIFLAWLVDLLRRMDFDLDRLGVVQFDSEYSIAMLSPPRIVAAHTAHPLREAQVEELERSWAALCSPSPEHLADMARASTLALRHLHSALVTIVGRYPDSKTGLSRPDECLLKCVSRYQPRVRHIIGHALVEAGEFGDYVGDSWYFWRLLKLAAPALEHKAVQLAGDLTFRGSSAEIAQLGREILEGRVSWLDVNATEEWIGGVHLDTRTNSRWLRDGLELRPC